MVNKINIATNLCLFYMIIYISGQALGNVIIIAVSLLVGYLSLSFSMQIDRFCLSFTFVVIPVFLLAFIFNNTYPFERLIFNSLFLYLNGMLAYSAVCDRIRGEKVLKGFIFTLVIYFVVSFILSTLSSQTVYSYMDSQLAGFSYNYISGLLVLSFSLLCACAKINETYKVKSYLILGFMIFIICFMLYGRSGIIFSFLLFTIILRDVLNFKRYENILLLGSFFLCVTIFITLYYDILLSVIMDSKFKEGIGSPRIMMLKDYFEELDAQSLVFGVDLNKVPLIASFNFNPHNSFLNLHAMYGIFSVAFMMFIILLFLHCFSLAGFSVILFLMIYIGRGMFDTIIFPGVTDFMFFYIIMKLCSHKIHLNRGLLC